MTHRLKTRPGSSRLRLAGVLVVWAGLALSPARAETVGPAAVFDAIESAWQDSRAEAMAQRVQVDGVRVRMGGSQERATEYSPSQAVYFFRGLFRARRTVEFRFTRLQDARGGERAHGMALWRYRAEGATVDREMRLVFLLTRQDDVWRISELNQISVR